MKKHLLFFILTLLPMLAMADKSGNCGNNVTYTYTEADCTLTIKGTGAMKDYYNNNSPWYLYTKSIKNIVIENGVTSIGDYAFGGCYGLTSITIPNSVTFF